MEETDDQQLQDLENLPEAELLEIPELNIAPGVLAAIWQRKAAVKEEQAETDIIARESNLQRRTQESKERERERRREAAFAQFEGMMREVEDRSDRLLERIEEEQLLARERLRKIDEQAIVLRDGRRAYVEGDSDYRDENGAILEGKDKDEAGQLRKQKPDASTWAEHADAERQAETLQELKNKVQKLHDDSGKEDGKGLSADELDARGKDYEKRLSGYEKDLQAEAPRHPDESSRQEQVTDATFGGADYMAVYEGTARTTSFASTLDNELRGPALNKDFTAAAVGQGPATVVKQAPNPTPSSAPAA